MRITHKQLESAMRDALSDLAILSGDILGPSDSTWQDVAGTCAVNLRHLAKLIDDSRKSSEPFLVFPSPAEVLDTI